MSDVNIKWLLPKKVVIKIWEYKFDAILLDWVYVLDTVLSKWIETYKVYVYMNWELFDDVDKYIALRSWDTLHLEYRIDVC